MARKPASANKKRKSISYRRYGYFFIAPFFILYLVFQLYPLLNTFYWSFFSYIKRNLQVTIEFCGFQNYLNVLGITPGETAYFFTYLKNTVIMWLCGFIPQILLSLLLAAWLTNNRIKLRGRGVIKVMTYMPNIIAASSISVLFGALFSQYGPITVTLKKLGVLASNFDFMQSISGTRGLISFILFWMWYGNTTLLLISGMIGINPHLYEAAEIDGASGRHSFFRITLPLLRPVLLYVLVTSAIGGFQMYDIPALFNSTKSGYQGKPADSTTTVTMYIMRLYSSDVGKAAATCILLFIVTLCVSLIFFFSMGNKEKRHERKARKLDAKAARKSN